MGIGFALLFWLAAASFAAAVLSSVALLVSSRQPAAVRNRRVMFAACPFGMLAWGLPAGLLWVGWGALTGLHTQFGLGDSWEVPLPRDYSLGFIDVNDRASIDSPRSQAPVVSGVTRIAVVGDRAFGIAGNSAFVLDMTSGQLQRGAFPALFVASGLDASALVPVNQYPGRALTAVDVVVALGLLFVPPLLVGRLVWSKI